MHAADDFHQRALARAVLAEQRVDFARLQLDVHACERTRGTEAFGDVGNSETHRGKLSAEPRRQQKEFPFSKSSGPPRLCVSFQISLKRRMDHLFDLRV